MDKSNQQKEIQYFTIPKNLIFNNLGKDVDRYWSLPQKPEIGTVGCFTADRAPNWDLFVVVDFDEKTHMITAIFPRLILDENSGNVLIGQDKLNECWHCDIQCECPAPRQGDDFGCHCGASEKINEQYHKTFKEMPDNTKYEAITFVHYQFREFNWIYHEHVKKEYLYELDYPMNKIGKCCRIV